MAYSKPQVTIDLEEYNELNSRITIYESADIGLYKTALGIALVAGNHHFLDSFKFRMNLAGFEYTARENELDPGVWIIDVFKSNEK